MLEVFDSETFRSRALLPGDGGGGVLYDRERREKVAQALDFIGVARVRWEELQRHALGEEPIRVGGPYFTEEIVGLIVDESGYHTLVNEISNFCGIVRRRADGNYDSGEFDMKRKDADEFDSAKLEREAKGKNAQPSSEG